MVLALLYGCRLNFGSSSLRRRASNNAFQHLVTFSAISFSRRVTYGRLNFSDLSREMMAAEFEDGASQESLPNGKSLQKGTKKRKIEDIYQKKTPIEHILLRPDTYVGSIEMQSKQMWVFENGQMAYRNVQFVPGLYKIFDEILVNAADNKVRDSSMDTIKVNISTEKGFISVYNNGRGIPVVVHEKEGVYVPELIFGHLLTSSNYDDNEKKMTGGRNGYGAKLCNIFSSEFKVETSDSASKLQFRQLYKKNMSVKMDPVISPAAADDFTRITFTPDLARFGMAHLDDDIVAVMKKRVYDIAGVLRGVKVFLNGERIKVKTFKDYVDMYLSAETNLDEPDSKKQSLIYEKVNDRWEVAVALHDGHQQVSFVNSICTIDGGTHVKYVLDPLIEKVVDAVKKKNKSAKLKPHQVREHLWIFVNCMIENPSFSSQTKEYMTLRTSQFGSKCTLGDDFVKRVLKSGVVEMILEFTRAKQSAELKKTDGNKKSRITGISKLDDANHAGTRHAKNCTLILTEGDSAKSLAVSGLSVVGRDLFGVFPLRGKMLNVRDANHSQILENQEVQSLKKILGLQQGKAYTSVDELRYGHIMIMTDADSVTGETPLLLRSSSGKLAIRTISNLFDSCDSSSFTGIAAGGKQYRVPDYETWTDKGWSKIRYAMRHKSSKRIYRVVTNTGVVDVTQDHSLLDANACKIKPKSVFVGDHLLHSFPSNFESGGSKKLDTVQSVFEENGFMAVDEFPEEILNATYDDRVVFFKELCASFAVSSGLDRKPLAKNSAFTLGIFGQVNAQGVYYLCKSLGYSLVVDVGEKNHHFFYLTGFKGTENLPTETQTCVKAIYELEERYNYVYDLETDVHHFSGGVGELVLHNTDGSHIKGLLINFLEFYWPSLLRIPGFLLEFITPIVRATKGSQELNFYTLPQYQEWKEKSDNGKGWHIKYYKGLGTSTAQDAKRYFSDLPTHMKTFKALENSDRGMVDMVFNKKRADDRKSWISQYIPGTFMNHDQETIGLTEFINKELILFSLADNMRSIPSVVDGFKPGQRKIFFGCLKRKLVKEVKVAQLAGYVSEHAAYHHGEQSLCQTIIGLAQNHVGSNNVNLLEPVGQFGTRLQGGKDHASARYIYTHLSKAARLLFHQDDDRLLNYLNDDGQSIEPEYYVPVLPMVLVNGAEGIGTGWSTSVPTFSPSDIAINLKRKLESPDVEFLPMKPYFRGFTGSVEQQVAGSDEKYKITGHLNVIDDSTIEITELPVGMWTQTYKEYLETLQSSDKQPALVKDFKEYHTDRSVHFLVTVAPSEMQKLKKTEDIEKKFKLATLKMTSNMVLFNSEGRLRKYSTVNEIMEEFYHLRLKYYRERKIALVDQLEKDHSRLSNKVRFVEEIINEQLIVQNRKKDDIIASLRAAGYDPQSTFVTAVDQSRATLQQQDSNDDEIPLDSGSDYDYLLNMAIWNLTREKVEKLRVELKSKFSELDTLRRTSVSDLWKHDLDLFLTEWHNVIEQDKAVLGARSAKKAKSKGIKLTAKEKTSGARPSKKLANTAANLDSDDDFQLAVSSQISDSRSGSPPPKSRSKAFGVDGRVARRSAKPVVYMDSESDDSLDETALDSEIAQEVEGQSLYGSSGGSETSTPTPVTQDAVKSVADVSTKLAKRKTGVAASGAANLKRKPKPKQPSFDKCLGEEGHQGHIFANTTTAQAKQKTLDTFVQRNVVGAEGAESQSSIAETCQDSGESQSAPQARERRVRSAKLKATEINSQPASDNDSDEMSLSSGEASQSEDDFEMPSDSDSSFEDFSKRLERKLGANKM